MASRPTNSWLLTSFVALVLVATSVTSANTQTAEDELGNWLIYNGTLQFTDQWGVFTEAQLRLYEVTSHKNEAFVRIAPQYNFTPDAFVALGYMRGATWPFDESAGDSLNTTENRIYEQFTIKQRWSRTGLEHRYRLEQRWIERYDGTEYRNRARYRLQVTVPITRKEMEPGALFLNTYDEIFIDLGSRMSLDQNRLYAAAGYQFSRGTNLQLGYLYNSRPTANLRRLQIFLTSNFDFR